MAIVPAFVQMVEQILEERVIKRLTNAARMGAHDHDSVFAFLCAVNARVRRVRQHWGDVEGSVVRSHDNLSLVVAESNRHLALENLECLGLIEVDM